MDLDDDDAGGTRDKSASAAERKSSFSMTPETEEAYRSMNSAEEKEYYL